MRFWDASAIVPLVLDEPGRDALLDLLERDAAIVAWWGTRPLALALFAATLLASVATYLHHASDVLKLSF